jgi:hypothetical protein
MGIFNRLRESCEAIDIARNLLTIGLVTLALLLQALGVAYHESDTSWRGIWRIFTETAPLTLAFLLIIPILFGGIKERGTERFLSVVVAPCVILIIATSIAVWFGHLNVFDHPPIIETEIGWLPLDIVIRGINLLGAYYHAYGPEKFWSSLILAVVLFGTLAELSDVWRSR